VGNARSESAEGDTSAERVVLRVSFQRSVLIADAIASGRGRPRQTALQSEIGVVFLGEPIAMRLAIFVYLYTIRKVARQIGEIPESFFGFF
jgi:hypothetical protein